MNLIRYALQHSLYITSAALIGYALTGSWTLALILSLIEPSVQLLALVAHRWFERRPSVSAEASQWLARCVY